MPIVVYHASAGTGKTFTLVRDFLTLLFRGDERVFRHVLAVTFTNKATAEMKGRILRVLDGLSRWQMDEGDPRVQEAELYAAALPDDLTRDPERLRKKARTALRYILYEYPSFAVMTIDSFFQRVLRSFARELSLPFTYEMEFDEERVLEEVTDMLLEKAAEDNELLRWLVGILDDPSNESGQWDIRRILLEQGKKIFSEAFRTLPPAVINKLTDRKFLVDLTGKLDGIIRDFEKKAVNYGERGQNLLREHGRTEEDFLQKKRGPAGIFAKLREGKFRKEDPRNSYFHRAVEDPEKWLTKKDWEEPALRNVVEEHLYPLSRDIDRWLSEELRSYYTARLVRKRLPVLGVLADMRELLYRWIRESDRMLISETGTFLHEVMKDNEIPFIYEKAGQFFRHFMIDEFQDTSRVQYEDLLPLLRDSLAAGGKTLIVGDIKQSLYRWRNGDWRIMHHDLYRDLRLGEEVKEHLSVNYRSRSEVVRFNNHFFLRAASELTKGFRQGLEEDLPELREVADEQISLVQTLYAPSEVVQKERQEAPGGYIRAEIVSGSEERDAREEALERTARLIDRLIDEERWAPGSIMLLVRANKDGRKVVRYLLERQHARRGVTYAIVSQDSLTLGTSRTVRFLIAFFRALIHPDDRLNRTLLWSLYSRLEGKEEPVFHELDLEQLPPARVLEKEDTQGKIAPWWSALLHAPLTEAVQKVIRRYGLNEVKEEIPFLHAFQNALLDLVGQDGAGVMTLLSWWDEKGKDVSVQMPEEVDAVRVLTIHKAKGLDADIVILPLLNWNFEESSGKKRKEFWCTAVQEPFSQVKLLPVEYTGQLLKTHFAADYLRERMATYLDHLNLLYVAFTRARERLYLFLPESRQTRTGSAYSLVKGTLEKMVTKERREPSPSGGEGAGDEGPAPDIRYDEESMVFEAGVPAPPVTAPQVRAVPVDAFPVEPSFGRLRVSSRGKEFFLLEKGGYLEKIDEGTLFHAIFAEIITFEDVKKAVAAVIRNGMAPAEREEELVGRVRRFLEQVPDRSWFDGSWSVRNEATLILPGGHTLRPDRVMEKEDQVVVLDYKFGETEEAAYRKQMKGYVTALRQLGYREVKGVLWYVVQNRTEELHG